MVAVLIILVGELVLLVDLGSRLFGSYARTRTGMAWRIAVLTSVGFALIAPVLWYWVDPDAAQSSVVMIAIVAGLMIFHFLCPYQWGIRRSGKPSSTNDLVDGVVLRTEHVVSSDLSESLQSITALVISDVHCNSDSQLSQLEAAVERLSESEDPDFVFLLGDFGEKKELLPSIINVLQSVSSRFGTFCVLGNHDHEGGRREFLLEILESRGICVLDNQVRKIPELGVDLVGVNYPWNHETLPSLKCDGFGLGLTHTPDNLVHFPGWGISIGVAGHTHGGKLRLPGFGPVFVSSRFGRFLDRGWFEYKGSQLCITPGIGYFPGRFGNVGEILRLTISSNAAGESHDNDDGE